MTKFSVLSAITYGRVPSGNRRSLANYLSMLRVSLTGCVVLLLVVCSTSAAQISPAEQPLQPSDAGTIVHSSDGHPTEVELSERMLRGMDRFMDDWRDSVLDRRSGYWTRNLSSRAAYIESVAPNRDRLKTITGVVDDRRPPVMQRPEQALDAPDPVAETDRYTIHQVRWPVLDGVWGEGLLLTPKGETAARVVALPDADRTPEQLVGLSDGVPRVSQYARRLAESGVQVVVPALLSRSSTFSGSRQMTDRGAWDNPSPVEAWTNQPHREWIYRQAFEMGRHVIGYEVQKILAAVDWFKQQSAESSVGIAGYGEGGLLALYAAAMDRRIDAALVSGYFGPREDLWEEPIYRNVWGLLEQFGDAEIGSLIAPRSLTVEYAEVPAVQGPPAADENERAAAASGKLSTPAFDAVAAEVDRLRNFFPEGAVIRPELAFVHGSGGQTVPFGSDPALTAFLEDMNAELRSESGQLPEDRRADFEPTERQGRQVRDLTRHIHDRMLRSDRSRYAFIKGDRSSPEAWDGSMEEYRTYLWEEVLGRVPDPTAVPNARLWKVFDREQWTGYQVVLDVWPEVISFGILCIPNDLEAGEERPVVVTQHGAGGLPRHTVRPEPDGSAGNAYNSYASRLAERGFITYAPHNPSGSRGGFPFRQIERKGNPLKASLFSLIIGQNQRILDWLGSLSYVDEERIGFYGLSWGGRTAMRVPAVLTDYRLSIVSGDFNDWVRKVMTVNYRNSYMYSGAYETYEFNLGHTFNHAELAGLIAPRPFMVESGYYDFVAADSWVGSEYAKVHRLYDLLGISDRTRLEFFNGQHEINGEGTFDFLHEHLDWPGPE